MKKRLRLPYFATCFLIFIICVILHNLIYALFGFEESLFFILALFSLVIGFILLLLFLGAKIKVLFKKVKKEVKNR